MNFIQSVGKKIKNSKISWWLISYSTVILLAILINFISNSLATNVLSKVVTKANIAVLSQMRMACDNIFHGIEINSSGLISMNEVQELASSSYMNDADRNDRVINIYQTIQSFNAGNRMIKECIILVKNRNLAITADGAGSMDVVFGTDFEKFYNNKNEWIDDMYSSSYRNGFQILEKDNKKLCFFVQILPVYNGAENVCVVTIIDENIMNRELENITNSRDRKCYIFDGDKVIFSSDGKNSSIELNGEIENESQVKINNENYIIEFIESDMEYFDYAVATSKKEHAKELARVNIIFNICYIVFLLLGGLLVWMFARINHSRQRETEERMLNQKKQLLRKILAENMLYPQEQKGVLTNAFIENDVPVFSRAHIVVIMDDFPENDMCSVKQEVFSQTFTEYMRDKAYVNECRIKSRYVTLLSFYEQISSASEVMDIIRCLKAEKGIEFICAASGLIYDLNDVHIAYEQAEEAMNTSFLMEKSEVLYDEILSFKSNIYEYDEQTESAVIASLKSGNAEASKQMLSDVITFNISKNPDAVMLQVFFTEIIATITKAAMQLEKYKEGDLGECFTIVAGLKNGSKQTDELCRIFDEYIEYLCEAEDNCVEDTDKRCELIKEFIKNNLTDINLNVSMIMAEFSLSRSYLSTYFKKHTGLGVAEYITRCRINTARDLLKNTDMSINEISENIGFTSLTTFFRAFKQHENVTPNLYRKQYHK